MGKYFKITDKLYEEKSLDEIIELLEPKAKEYIDNYLYLEKMYLIENMIDCESPIERLFSMAMNQVILSSEGRQIASGITDMFLSNQEDVICGNNQYRVDFMLHMLKRNTGKEYTVIIECDGHDFHEKTKAQATKDKRRERELTKHGYTVIRFTGSEIYHSALTCAREVINLVIERFGNGGV